MALSEHIISGEEILVDTQKIEAVQNWPRPKSLIDNRSFVGWTSYYRWFTGGFVYFILFDIFDSKDNKVSSMKLVRKTFRN